MNKALSTLVGASLGSGAMYFLDPQLGRRRRAILRDKAESFVRRARLTLEAASRDLANRARGAMARLESSLWTDGAVSDDLVIARARSQLGRVVSHPSSIIVDVDDGRLVLRGPILANEVEDLLASVRRVRGVRTVENRLEVHESPAGVPGLQGEAAPRRAGFLEARWPPGVQLMAGGAGMVLLLTGAPGLPGRALSRLGGALLLARAIANPPVDRPRRERARRRPQRGGGEEERMEAPVESMGEAGSREEPGTF